LIKACYFLLEEMIQACNLVYEPQKTQN